MIETSHPAHKNLVFKEKLSALSKALHHDGQKIVLTNGIFDFLHAGHVTYLEQAKALGDILVVAINSDRSTKRLKGEGRPINTEKDRALVVGALRCVDYVCIFEEDTAQEVIHLLQPDIYTKGGDYTPETLPETPAVQSYGGEIIIIPLHENHSNSHQYKKIKALPDQEKRADTVSTR